MISHPDEYFSILEDMDTLSMSESQKDRRAVLLAYLAVVYVAPVDMSPADLDRATSAFNGTANSLEVKSLLVQSEFAKASGNPVMRLELLKDAEFLASQLGDDSDLAFVYLYLSKVYSNAFNGLVGEYYANKSLRLFRQLGYMKQSIDARMAIVGALAAKRDYSTMLDSLLALKPDVLTYSTPSYQTYFLDQLARSLDEGQRSEEAIAVWHSLYSIDDASANTLAHWARAYVHMGDLDSAEVLINKALSYQLIPSDEYLCRNVQYDIMERLGRKSELPLIDSLRNQAANVDYDARQIPQSSLALNVKYDSATRHAWAQLQANRLRAAVMLSVAVIAILVLAGGLLYYRKRNMLLRVENENTLLRIQALEHNLFEKEREHTAVAESISELFRAPFKTIDQLASAYFECKETSAEQKRIFAQAKAAIQDFSSPHSLAKLEAVVNGAQNHLMEHFDEDFPKVSAAQRRLALYLFCGLSLQSISIFLATDMRNLYVYKSRLKSVITKSASPRRDLYLAYF